MEYFGKGLYLIFFALVFWFIHRAQGRGLGRLVEDNHRAHERVHHVLEEHPEGGTWPQYKQWMEAPLFYFGLKNLLRHMAPIQAVDGGRNMSLETTTLGAGCFWCVEAVYQNLRGIASAVSGYMGGALEHPTYEAVCSGRTGHAEVVQLQFDPEVISFDDVLYIFWRTHDPTTLNRQGADSGTQYRSAIFYHSPEQQETATASKVNTDKSDLWAEPIVTEIAPASTFWPAEDYHQNYYRLNPNQPYCAIVIDPKMSKFRQEFADRLQPTA